MRILAFVGRVRVLRTVAYAVLVSVVISACSTPADRREGADDAVDAAARTQVERLRALPFTTDSLRPVEDVLAAAGVEVVDDVTSSPGGGMALTRWQVANLAAEAANGGGVSGDTLAVFAPVPKGAPPVAYLLAAWVSGYDSPAARFTRALLGERDWRNAGQVVFPKLALTLFVADAVAYGRAAPTTRALALAGHRVAAGGPCDAASRFIQNGIAQVANLLKVDTGGGGLFGFLGRLWNRAVDLAAGVVAGLLKTLAAPVVEALVDVFGVLATLQEVASYVTVWRIAPMTFTPKENVFGVDGAVVTGEAELHVVDGQLPVPDWVVGCGKLVGVDLSKAGSSEGSAVVWDVHNDPRRDLAAIVRADDVLDAKRNARLVYQTGQETSELVRNGVEQVA